MKLGRESSTQKKAHIAVGFLVRLTLYLEMLSKVKDSLLPAVASWQVAFPKKNGPVRKLYRLSRTGKDNKRLKAEQRASASIWYGSYASGEFGCSF
jgi:hypothetical protein